MLTMKPSEIAPSSSACQILFARSRRDDRIGQRDRAQREFLALVDVVLDEDAARSPLARACSERLGSISDQPRHQHQQRAGHQECDEDPHPARRALEMIEQPGQHQQLEGGTDGVKPRAPCRVRPERADERPDRPARAANSRSAASAIARRPANPSPMPRRRASTSTKIADQRRRPGQRERGQNRENIRNRRPQRPVAPVPPHQRHRRSRSTQAHALPPRARSTSDVVLWPGRISTSTTSPPAASTISWPTTCSRV